MQRSRIMFLILWIGAATLTHAQQPLIKVCYDSLPLHNDTFFHQIFMQSLSPDSIAVRAINFSFAFNDSCTTYLGVNSFFADKWGPFFEDTLIQKNLALNYNGINYNSRLQYGISDPGLGMSNPILLPTRADTALLTMTLKFMGPCSSELYMEKEQEHIVNQIGDTSFNRIEYEVVSCYTSTGWAPRLPQLSIQAGPVPGRDFLFVSINRARNLRYKWRLLDLSGQEVGKGDLEVTSASIDLRPYPSGIYFMEIMEGEKNGKRGILRLVKQ